MSDARTAILSRLRQVTARETPDLPNWTPWVADDTESAKDRFIRMMTSYRGEVIEVKPADFVAALKKLLDEKGVQKMLWGPKGKLASLLAGRENEIPQLVAYDKPATEFKQAMFFDYEAGLTSTKGAIAETGSLIVWPSPEEPRLMSVVPPLHIAVVLESEILNSYTEAVHKLDWNHQIPANAVLISGPSKTSDIEGILCFGVHGPKELAIFILQD